MEGGVPLEIELVRVRTRGARPLRRAELIDDVDVRGDPAFGLVGVEQVDIQLRLERDIVVVTERREGGLERHAKARDRRRHIEREDHLEDCLASLALDFAIHFDTRRAEQVLDRPGRLDLELRSAEEHAARLTLRERRYGQQQARLRRSWERCGALCRESAHPAAWW